MPLGCALSEPVLTPCAFLLVANVLCPVRVVEHSDCISMKSHSRLCCPSWSFVKWQHFSNRREVFLAVALGSLWRNWTKSSDRSLCVCQNCSHTFKDILGTETSARMLCCKADAVWGTPNSRIIAVYLNFFYYYLKVTHVVGSFPLCFGSWQTLLRLSDFCCWSEQRCCHSLRGAMSRAVVVLAVCYQADFKKGIPSNYLWRSSATHPFLTVSFLCFVGTCSLNSSEDLPVFPWPCWPQ